MSLDNPRWELLTTADGSHTLIAPASGVTYHSKNGALGESRHVFIEAGLDPVLDEKNEARVLEVGFGTGLNALLTLAAARSRQATIDYWAIEPFPISAELAQQLNYPSIVGGELAENFLRMHQADTNETLTMETFRLHRLEKPLVECDLPNDYFDVVYFDAFAPSDQPDVWDTPSLGRLARALRVGGRLVTFCAQGAFRRRLADLGFSVGVLPGPVGKRHMTRGIRIR